MPNTNKKIKIESWNMCLGRIYVMELNAVSLSSVLVADKGQVPQSGIGLLLLLFLDEMKKKS